MDADATALRHRLVEAAREAGFEVSIVGAGLTGVRQAILARWLFGRRVADHRFQLTLDAKSRSMTFSEAVHERGAGLAPPSWFLGLWHQRGAGYREVRSERGPWGGGIVEFGALRDALRRVADQSGWDFRYAPMAMPAAS